MCINFRPFLCTKTKYKQHIRKASVNPRIAKSFESVLNISTANSWRPLIQNRNVIRSCETITYWQQHLDAQMSSGLKQSAYCREHNISDKYFSAWKGKLRKTASKKSNDVQWVPVSIKRSIAPTKPIAELPSDTIELSLLLDGIDFTKLKKLPKFIATSAL